MTNLHLVKPEDGDNASAPEAKSLNGIPPEVKKHLEVSLKLGIVSVADSRSEFSKLDQVQRKEVSDFLHEKERAAEQKVNAVAPDLSSNPTLEYIKALKECVTVFRLLQAFYSGVVLTKATLYARKVSVYLGEIEDAQEILGIRGSIADKVDNIDVEEVHGRR